MNKMMKRPGLVVGVAMGLVALSSADDASALTTTGTLNVSASVTATCAVGVGTLAFGAYDTSAATDLDVTGNVSVTCTANAPVVLTLGAGSNSSGGTADAPVRRMASGTNFLAYQVYRDSARTNILGGTVASGLAGSGSGVATPVSVYGRIPKLQSAASGSYADSVVATLDY